MCTRACEHAYCCKVIFFVLCFCISCHAKGLWSGISSIRFCLDFWVELFALHWFAESFFFLFPGKTCARGCLKGNGAGDQQDCGHCWDYKGWLQNMFISSFLCFRNLSDMIISLSETEEDPWFASRYHHQFYKNNRCLGTHWRGPSTVCLQLLLIPFC